MIDLRMGNCLELLKTIPSASINAVIMDSPYNVSVKNGDLKGLKIKRLGKAAGKRDFGEWDFNFEVAPLLPEINRVLSTNGQVYAFSMTDLLPDWICGLKNICAGVKVLDWIKPDPVPQVRQRFYCSANEFIVWAWRGKYTFNWLGHKNMYTWYQCQSPKHDDRVHPTQKPLRLIKRLINVSTRAGDTILDPFMGSGTTMVACAQLKRNGIGFELLPEYFAIAEKRVREAQLQESFL